VNTLNHVTRPAPAADDRPPALPSTSQSGAVADLCDTTAEMETAQVSNRFEAILPVPVRKRPQSTRTVLKSPTHILTGKEHSDLLKEKQSKKKQNQGKTKDQSKLKKKSLKGTPPPATCYHCHVQKHSDADRALAQGWIQCCRCPAWCHEQCGKESGVFDDEEFLCDSCAKKLP